MFIGIGGRRAQAFLSRCVAIRGAIALPTLGQFGALPHAQRAKRPIFNKHHFRRRNCDSFAK
jgi:hypothetical protein